MDQKKSDRKTFFSDNDHKLYLTGQKKSAFGGAVDKKTDEEVIRKEVIRKIVM